MMSNLLIEWNESNPNNIKELSSDITVFPYVPGFSAVILKMGEDIRGTFNTDAYGNDLNSLPIMAGINSYNEILLSMVSHTSFHTRI